MEIITQLLPYYLLAVNLLTFLAYGIDKWKAVHNGHRSKHQLRRIPEVSLLLLAALGGSPAALLAMYLFRHKTHHKKFRYGVPLILFLQIAIIVVIMCNNNRSMAL